MDNNSEKSEPEHVWKDYYECLHDEIASCQTQVIAALRARRFENTENFKINGKRASYEEICEASEILADKRQAPRHETRLWKHSKYIIKKRHYACGKVSRKYAKAFKGSEDSRPSESGGRMDEENRMTCGQRSNADRIFLPMK